MVVVKSITRGELPEFSHSPYHHVRGDVEVSGFIYRELPGTRGTVRINYVVQMDPKAKVRVRGERKQKVSIVIT